MPPKRRSPKLQSTVAKTKAAGCINVPKPVILTNSSSNDAGTSSRQSPNITRQNQRSPGGGGGLIQGNSQPQGHTAPILESDWLSINASPHMSNGYEFNSISNHISSNANSNNNNIIMSEANYITYDKYDNTVSVSATTNNNNNNTNVTPRDRDTPTQLCGLTLAPTQKLDLQNLVNSQIQEIQLEHRRSLNASSSSAQNSPRLQYSSSSLSNNILNVTTIECSPIPEDMSELTTVAEKTTVSDTLHHRNPYHHGVAKHHHLFCGVDDKGLNTNNNNISSATLKYRHEVGTVLEEMSDNELAAYLDEVMRITHKRGLGNSNGTGDAAVVSSSAIEFRGSEQGHAYKSATSATPPSVLVSTVLQPPQPLQHPHSPLHHAPSILQSPNQQQQQIGTMNVQSYRNLNSANAFNNSGDGVDGVGGNINRRFRSKSTGSDPTNICVNSYSYSDQSNDSVLKCVNKITTIGTGLQQQMSSGPISNTSIRNTANNLFYKSSSSPVAHLTHTGPMKGAALVNIPVTSKNSGGKMILSEAVLTAIDATGASKKKNRDVSQEMWTKMTALVSHDTSASSGLSGVSGTTTQSSRSSITQSQPLQQQQYMQYMHSNNSDTELDCGEDPELLFNNLTIGNNSNSTTFTVGGGGSYGRESPTVAHMGHSVVVSGGAVLRSATPNPLYSLHYPGSNTASGVGNTCSRNDSPPTATTTAAVANGRLHPCDKMFDHRLTPSVVTSASSTRGVSVYNMSGGVDGAGICNTVFTNLSPPTLVSDNMSFLYRMSPLNTAAAVGTCGGVIGNASSSSGGSTPHRRSTSTISGGTGTIASARNKNHSQPSPTSQSQSQLATLHSKPQQRQSPVNSQSTINRIIHHSNTNNNTSSNGNYVRPHCTKKVPENFFNYLIASDAHSTHSNNANNNSNNITFKACTGRSNSNAYSNDDPQFMKAYSNNNHSNSYANNTSSNSSVGSNSTYSNSTSALSLLSQGVMTSPYSAFAFKGTAVAAGATTVAGGNDASSGVMSTNGSTAVAVSLTGSASKRVKTSSDDGVGSKL